MLDLTSERVYERSMDLTSDGSRVMSAPEAARVCDVTYRMLDHWDRVGWISPSRFRAGASRTVRGYTENDLVKVRALRAVGRAGLDVGRWGEAIGRLDVSSLDLILITGDDRLLI